MIPTTKGFVVQSIQKRTRRSVKPDVETTPVTRMSAKQADEMTASGRKVDLKNLMQTVESSEGNQPAKVALVGCGTFVQRTYLPLLETMREKLQVVAAWSRTRENADVVAKAVEKYEGKVEVYSGEEGFHELLRSDVEACVVALPVQVQLQHVRAILRAGKHVLQEKPIDPEVDSVLLALEEYRELAGRKDGKLVWGIEENYRFEEAFLYAESVVKSGRLGDILKCVLNVDHLMNSNNVYFASKWRKDKATFPGGFLLDSSVHFMAALRKVVGGEITGKVSSVCLSSNRSDVPVPTTLCGLVMMGSSKEGGIVVPCSVSITMASGIQKFQLSVTGTNGTVHVERNGPGYIVNVQEDRAGASEVRHFAFTGVERALSSFAQKVRYCRAADKCTVEDLGSLSPYQGALDLATIQSFMATDDVDRVGAVLKLLQEHTRDLK